MLITGKIVILFGCYLIADAEYNIAVAEGVFQRDFCSASIGVIINSLNQASYSLDWPENHVEASPWVVSLQLRKVSSSAHFCSGTIIAPKFVLTTAYCLREYGTDDIEVVAGVSQTTRSFGSFRQVFAVENIKVHSFYDEFTSANDIGIIQLKNAIGLGAEMSAMDISWDATHYFDNCEMIGWTLKEEQLNVRFQRSISLEVLSKSNCTKSYGDLRDESFCAYAKSDEIGLCVGNWGDGVVCDGSFVGILSWRSGCSDGKVKMPYVFTNVSYYQSWILDVINSPIMPVDG